MPTWLDFFLYQAYRNSVRRSPEKLVAVKMNVVIVPRALREAHAVGVEPRRNMETIELEPKYSGKEISGKCLKCLAEQKLSFCLRELLTSNTDNPASQQQYEALVGFLQSPESENLRSESEKCLSEGKQVVLKILYENKQPRYDLQIKE